MIWPLIVGALVGTAGYALVSANARETGHESKEEAVEEFNEELTEEQVGISSPWVEVIPANDDVTVEQLFRTAFEGNPAFAGTVVNEKMNDTYVLFEADVAQFFNDNFASPYGVTTMSYEAIARDVIGDNVSVFISSAPMVG